MQHLPILPHRLSHLSHPNAVSWAFPVARLKIKPITPDSKESLVFCHQTLTLTLNPNLNPNPNPTLLLVSHHFSVHDVVFSVIISHDTSPPAIHLEIQLLSKFIPFDPVFTKTVLAITKRFFFAIPSLKIGTCTYMLHIRLGQGFSTEIALISACPLYHNKLNYVICSCVKFFCDNTKVTSSVGFQKSIRIRDDMLLALRRYAVIQT